MCSSLSNTKEHIDVYFFVSDQLVFVFFRLLHYYSQSKIKNSF